MRNALRTIDALIANAGEEIVVSGGGEPLLHPRIAELFEHLSGNGQLHRRLYTHGGSLPPVISKIADAFDYVRISVDAGEPALYSLLHGPSEAAFGRLFASARDLASAGVVVGISMVVTNDSVVTIPALLEMCARHKIPYLFLKPVMNGMWRVPMPSLMELDRVTGNVVKVFVRGSGGLDDAAVVPEEVASMAVTLNADNFVYPCCHLTTPEWRICAVGDDIGGDFRERLRQIAAAYSLTRHACRVHDAWQSWTDASGPIGQVGRIADRLMHYVGLPLAELADGLAPQLVANQLQTISITGPSSVGKTTFAGTLAESIRRLRMSCTTIMTDDFLLRQLRGQGTYRKNSSFPLEPANYSFDDLAATVGRLRDDESVLLDSYVRGSGWVAMTTAIPADVVVLEGLFLDSIDASFALATDLVLVIEALPSAIGNWRRVRDNSVREHREGSFRSADETEREIAQTMRSYADYERSLPSKKTIRIAVGPDHVVTAVELVGSSISIGC